VVTLVFLGVCVSVLLHYYANTLESKRNIIDKNNKIYKIHGIRIHKMAKPQGLVACDRCRYTVLTAVLIIIHNIFLYVHLTLVHVPT